MAATVTDGRVARSRRTRDAVIAALHALIEEGDPRPSARKIAERAGISLRSVFVHFASLDDLHRAAADRAAVLVVGMLWPIDPALPLAARVDALCTQRARVNEEIGPLRRAAALQEPFSPPLAEARANTRRASRDQIERVFAAELAAYDDDARRRRVATVDAAISGETWDILRADGLTVEAARHAMRESVGALLGVLPTATGSTTPDTPPADQPSRHGVIADLDARIARLLAAIEAGTPAEVVAPRLQELTSARTVAQRTPTPRRG